MKNKKDLIIYSIIAVVIVFAIILVILYFTTDIFKSNQQLFYKYLAQTKIINSDFITQYKAANNVLSENSNSSNMKIKVLNSKINPETQVSDIKELFNIDSKGLNNALLNQSYRDFVFSNNSQTFLTVKYLKDNNTYGIIADNILGKYLSVDNSNLKELFSKLGMKDTSIIPDSITVNYEELLSVDEVALEELEQTYFTLIYENIKKENYYKIINEDKTQTIGISLSEQELFDITKLILETTKNDNTFLNLFIDKLQLLNYNNIDLETIQSEIQKYIEEINNNTYSTDKDYIQLSLSLKDNQVISVEIGIKYKEETIVDAENISYIEHNKSFRIDFLETNNICFTVKENDMEIINITFNYSYDSDKISFYTEMILYENEKTNTLKLQYQTSNYQTDNVNQACVIDIILPNEKYQIDIYNDITLKEDVQISKLTSENSAKINEMTSEELKQLMNAISNRINELYSVDLISLYNANIIDH